MPAAAHVAPLLCPSFPLPLEQPFTLAQALEAGITRHILRTLRERSYVRRLLKGVYVAAQAQDSVLLRARGLRLVVPDDAVVTDWTACWLHTGLLAPGQHLEVPPVSVFRPSDHGRLRNGLCVSGERWLPAHHIQSVAGLRVTTPIRTAWDLGRLDHRDRAIGGMDALMRHSGFSPLLLVAGVEQFRGHRGVRQLRALATLVDPRAESPRESLLRLRWLDMPSLPRPTPQVPVLSGGVEVYRLDLAVAELRYACEYDGAEFHDPESEHDEARREDLRQRFGWTVDVVRNANVTGRTRDVEEKLSRGIDGARARLARPPYLG